MTWCAFGRHGEGSSTRSAPSTASSASLPRASRCVSQQPVRATATFTSFLSYYPQWPRWVRVRVRARVCVRVCQPSATTPDAPRAPLCLCVGWTYVPHDVAARAPLASQAQPVAVDGDGGGGDGDGDGGQGRGDAGTPAPATAPTPSPVLFSSFDNTSLYALRLHLRLATPRTPVAAFANPAALVPHPHPRRSRAARRARQTTPATLTCGHNPRPRAMRVVANPCPLFARPCCCAWQPSIETRWRWRLHAAPSAGFLIKPIAAGLLSFFARTTPAAGHHTTTSRATAPRRASPRDRSPNETSAARRRRRRRRSAHKPSERPSCDVPSTGTGWRGIADARRHCIYFRRCRGCQVDLLCVTNSRERVQS